MGENADEFQDSVSVSMELTGKYEDILARLDTAPATGSQLVSLTDDLEVVLETVERLGGGTRSSIATHLPEDMAVDYDAEAVVPVLQVLERYGLVSLDGNTWYPSG